MKNFKLKLNFLFNLFKKNSLIKKINISYENVKNYLKFQNLKKKGFEIYNEFYLKKFKINFLLFFVSLILFYYLIYLSFPGILHNKSDQNYLTKLLKDQYDLEFSLTPEISYSILPKPHFQINDVVVFNNKDNFQKKLLR